MIWPKKKIGERTVNIIRKNSYFYKQVKQKKILLFQPLYTSNFCYTDHYIIIGSYFKILYNYTGQWYQIKKEIKKYVRIGSQYQESDLRLKS